jgi:hypothetical protein
VVEADGVTGADENWPILPEERQTLIVVAYKCSTHVGGPRSAVAWSLGFEQ